MSPKNRRKTLCKKINSSLYILIAILMLAWGCNSNSSGSEPENVIENAEIRPDSGPPDTDIILEVTIHSDFAEEVTRVEADIDMTDENIELTEISTGVWQRGSLSAPEPDSYPRIDTFTLTAFNGSGEAMESRSVEFTITEPEGNSTSEITWDKKLIYLY